MFKIWEISWLYSDFLEKSEDLAPSVHTAAWQQLSGIKQWSPPWKGKDSSSLPQSLHHSPPTTASLSTVATSTYISSPSLCHSPHHSPFYTPMLSSILLLSGYWRHLHLAVPMLKEYSTTSCWLPDCSSQTGSIPKIVLKRKSITAFGNPLEHWNISFYPETLLAVNKPARIIQV